ncbi:MAG: mechanosensitive ion channel domain-containing protein [Acidimicrobiales bacterium]
MDTAANSTWAVIVIIAIPALIIAAAEIDERLRQRESPLRRAVLILRNWSLPFFAIWTILVPVLQLDRDDLGVQLVASGLVLSVGASVLAVLRVVVDDLKNRPVDDDRRPIPQLLLALPRLVALIAIGWILIDTVWGVDLSAALTALGVTSLVISFALQDTLSGLASGMLLLSDPPFQPDDWISSGDVEGQVVDVNWRTTRVRTRNGDVITVTNASLASANITNFSSPEGLHRVIYPVQVAYMNPPTLAKAMLLDAARATEGVLEYPPPNVVVVQTDDPLMGYEVQMWINDYSIEPRVKSDFGGLVWYQSHRHGVPLPSPAQDLYLYDGTAVSAEGEPSVADIRRALQQSPMLASLDDGELDQMARGSTMARFAVEESMADSRASARDLIVIVEGRARLALETDKGGELQVGEVGDGDVIDVKSSSSRDTQPVVLRAITDCEVVLVDADVVGEIGSRNADIAAAFNRMAAIRRRRIERTSQRGEEVEISSPPSNGGPVEADPSADSDDSPVEGPAR